MRPAHRRTRPATTLPPSRLPRGLCPLDLLAQQLEPEPFFFRRSEFNLDFREFRPRRGEALAVACVEIGIGEQTLQSATLGVERRDTSGRDLQGVLLGVAQAPALL